MSLVLCLLRLLIVVFLFTIPFFFSVFRREAVHIPSYSLCHA
jgi:hypothetical protein